MTAPAFDMALRTARMARRRALESAWRNRLAQGIAVGGLVLRCEESDRNAFSQLLVMLAEAERLGQLPTLVPVADRANAIHTLPVADLRALLVAYGAAYQSLWLEKVAAHNAIEAAGTVDAVAAVAIPWN